MSVWKASTAPDGRTYYWNTETKATTWTKPDDFEEPEPATPAAAATLATPQDDTPWREVTDKQGRTYYHNTQTNETSWQPPANFQNPQQQNARPQGQGLVAGGAQNYSNHDDFGAQDRRADRRGGHGLPQKPSFDGGRSSGMPWERGNDNMGFRGPMPIKTDEPEYGTYDQAEDAFVKMLRKNNISSDTKWEDALRIIIKERDYRAIKDPKERKQAFEKYLQGVRAEEKGKEKERQEKLREDFRKMLATHDDIKHYTRWKTARPIIEREAVFKSAGDDDLRRRVFDEYILDLKKKAATDEIATRRSARQDMVEMLKALIVDPDTKWADAQKLITESERFKSDDRFRALSNADIANSLLDHLVSLDHVANAEVQEQKRLSGRRQRQVRDDFKQLLQEKVKQGKLNAATKWKDFYPLIEKDERLINLLGNPGSDPLELFWDAVEIEDGKHRPIRNMAMDVLEAKQFEFSTDTSLEDFANVMQTDPKTAKLSDDQVKLTYDKLMEKVKRRAKAEREDYEKHQRKAMKALTHAIGEMRPSIRANDRYEDVLPKLQELREWRGLDDESRRTAFDKHIRYAREKEDDRAYRDRDRDRRNGSRRENERDSDRRRDNRTPEANSYEEERKKAQATREGRNRKPSFGLTPPRDRRDEREDRYRRHDKRDSGSMYDRERREREIERERSYISRADPRDKGRALDYGDEDVAGSRPGSVRKRRDSDGSAGGRRDPKRLRRGEPDDAPEEKEELVSGSEEGEIEEV